MFCNLLQAMHAWGVILYASPEKVAHARGELALPPPPTPPKKCQNCPHPKKGIRVARIHHQSLYQLYRGGSRIFMGGGGAKDYYALTHTTSAKSEVPFGRDPSLPILSILIHVYYKNRHSHPISGGGGVPVAPLDPPAWTTKQKQTWTKILNQNHDMQYL